MKKALKVEVIGSGSSTSTVTTIVEQIKKDEGTQKDWRNGIPCPMPRIYPPDETLIGKKVLIKECNMHDQTFPAEGYSHKEVSMTGNCNCELRNKVVTITGLKQTDRASFYRSTCYTIAESSNLIHEEEFSSDEPEESGTTNGYIFEGKGCTYLTAAYVWLKKEKPENGYLHNTGIARSLSQANFSELGEPVQVYKGTYFWKEGNLKVIGEPISWSDFKKKMER